MVAKVICMASSKGGSGKTILSITFATLLQALGKRVLVIDTDAATNGLTLLHLQEVSAFRASPGELAPRGVYESGSRPADPFKLASGVHLIPATYEFIETEKVPVEKFRLALKATLQQFREEYDFVFLDAQAGFDMFSSITMRRDISDEVIIVSEYDPVSAAGVERLKVLGKESLSYDRTWILLNKMLPEFVKSYSDFLGVARYLSPIPWSADVVRAFARRKLALDTDEGNEYTLAIIRTLQSLLGDEIESAIKEWMAQRESSIREPIRNQLRDLEIQISGLVKRRIDLQYGKKSIRFMRLTFLAAAGSVPWIVYNVWQMEIFEASAAYWFSIGVALMVTIAGTYTVWIRRLEIQMKEDEIEEISLRSTEDHLRQKLITLQGLEDADLSTLLRKK